MSKHIYNFLNKSEMKNHNLNITEEEARDLLSELKCQQYTQLINMLNVNEVNYTNKQIYLNWFGFKIYQIKPEAFK